MSKASLGLTNATASRNVSYWCEMKKYGTEGVGFIKRTEDPRDRRYKLLSLTKEGKRFYERVQAARSASVGGGVTASD